MNLNIDNETELKDIYRKATFNVKIPVSYNYLRDVGLYIVLSMFVASYIIDLNYYKNLQPIPSSLLVAILSFFSIFRLFL